MRGRLQAAIGSLASDPRPPGCIKLSGHRNAWRIREGDWRIIYEVYDKHLEVIVAEVATRDEAYEGY
jgi:mRNA interferase RelE/StbE